ncbi:hypothetical protein MATL_G00034980 [Megalops atlanticus]|uniref:EMILIN-2-like n=1 Tax=Megalops atlanticus TaxID=7932 RepID=A0A9D3QHS1_MEGAT|nr:hypothetical protein MATL_G00034980 [Megalops atlanticus]
MKCVIADSRLELIIFSLLLTFSLISGTPSRFSANLFQGTAYSGTGQRPRNKNWCAYVVHKNVTCAVLGATESFIEPEIAPCPMHLPDCPQQVMYRTQFRPTYKIGYKLVTELEWRCCPAFQGPDCQELKDTPPKQAVLGPHTHPRAGPAQMPSAQGPETVPNNLPSQPQQRPQQQQQKQEGDKVRALEEEVQRLSQTVLDLQAAMTGMNENLRVNIQEDTSKMLVTLLNNMRPPDSALAGATDSIRLQEHGLGQEHRAMEEVMARLNDVTDTLKSKSDILEELQGTVTGHDGQLRLLMEAAQGPLATAPVPVSLNTFQAYVDDKIKDLRQEMMEGIEIKMADLKNSCEYQITSIAEQCEGHETSYLSLAELLDTKEADLRKEIHDLRLNLSLQISEDRGSEQLRAEVGSLQREVGRIAEAHQALNARLDSELEHLSGPQVEDTLGQRLEDVEARLNVTEKNCEVHCVYMEDKMSRQIGDEVAKLRKQLEERVNTMEDQFTAMLVEINNNSLPGIYSDTVDALENEVKSNKYLIEGLEEKLNALGEVCATECRSDREGLDNMKQDLKVCRDELDVLNSGVSGNSEKLKALEDLLQRQLLIGQQSSKDLADLQSGLSSLKDNVGGLGGTVTGLSRSLSKYAQDLHHLNSTCSETNVACQKEAKETRDLLDHRLSGMAVNNSQVEELKRGLVQLGSQVRSELVQCRESTEGIVKEVSSVDGRVANVENMCGKLDTMSGTLQRIKEGLNKHVTSLWNCISYINGTLRAHSKDINGLKGSVQSFQTTLTGITKDIQDLAASTPSNPVVQVKQEKPAPPAETKTPSGPKPRESTVSQARIPLVISQVTIPVTNRPRHRVTHRHTSKLRQTTTSPLQPVMETGEAGPPGTMRKTLLKLPQSDSGTMDFTGVAGAPGYPPLSPVSFKPNVIPAAHTPQKPVSHKPVVALAVGDSAASEPFSFSAGLTVLPFTGETGVIRFNKVLVNDGGHYDPNTGVFTVPTEGRYLVSAVLMPQRGERVQAVLSVSNRSVQRLDTWGHQRDPLKLTRPAQDACSCGGSASFNLVLNLKRGDRVALVVTAGKLATSESSEVASTFSAVFLYPPQFSR